MNLRRIIANYRILVLSLLVFLFGIGLMYWAEQDWWKGWELWRTVVRELGAMLFTTVAVALLWELFGKRALVDEVFEIAGISEPLKDSGIVHVTPNFYKDLEWKAYFEASSKLDILLDPEWSTWFTNNQEFLEAFLNKQNAKMRVLLPKPRDEGKWLKERFAKTFNT